MLWRCLQPHVLGAGGEPASNCAMLVNYWGGHDALYLLSSREADSTSTSVAAGRRSLATTAVPGHPTPCDTRPLWPPRDGAGGELGNGGDSDQRSPVPVSGNAAFSATTGGWLHSCALKLDNTTLCWGSSPGNGFNTDSYNPVPVAAGHSFLALTAGVFHTCGLDASGAIWCFGAQSSCRGLWCGWPGAPELNTKSSSGCPGRLHCR